MLEVGRQASCNVPAGRSSFRPGKSNMRRGAVYYSDSISDDAQPGKVTSFPQAVQLKDAEVVALA